MNPKKHFRGITMMELMVSLNIICLAIFGMAVILCMLLRSSQENLDNSSAYIVADSVLKEYLEQNKYNLVETTTPTASVVYGDRTFNYQINCIDTGDNLFYIKVTVFDDADLGGAAGSSKVFVSTLQRRLMGGEKL